MLVICDYCGWLQNLPLETFPNQIENHLSLLAKLQLYLETYRGMNLNDSPRTLLNLEIYENLNN